MNRHFVEKNQIASGFVPVNLATGANNGDWVSLKGYGRCAIVLFKGAGTAAQDPTITLEQARTVGGSGNKALDITRVDKKQGAALTSIGTFTKSTAASPATNDTFSNNTWTNSTLAEEQAIVVIDVRAEDLDIDGGFDCIQAKIADVGTNSQIAGMLYVLHEPRYGMEALPSAIID
jgi:hypothetical protein